jgi:hypothetical protein
MKRLDGLHLVYAAIAALSFALGLLAGLILN